MRVLAVDWGTSRVRAYLIEAGQVVGVAQADEGVSRLGPGKHRAVFEQLCGAWLAVEPELPVALVGMVGSREGWFPAPYVACPAGPAEIATGLTQVDLGAGRHGLVVPGVSSAEGRPADVMRGEETHLLGSGVADGLVCLPGTHCKWALMEDGRLVVFATFLTGELYGLLRAHSMVGRPAAEPPDNAGFALGLSAAERDAGADTSTGGLLNLLFGARAATLTGRLSPAALGPYLSGLLTAAEIAGAVRMFGRPRQVTIVADPPRVNLYREALGGAGIETVARDPATTLAAGIRRILEAR